MQLTRVFWLTLVLSLPALATRAQVQYVTLNPAVDETHDREVRIQRVELTAGNTILYLSFFHKAPKMPRLPEGFDQQEDNSSIQFEPTAMLFANRGNNAYKFVRAQNIPTNDRLKVVPGKRVDFVAYFERLDPGVTVFDLFECNDRDGNICFNFYGVHVTNPKKKPESARPGAPIPAPPAKPAEPVKPVLPVKPARPTKPNAATAAATVATLTVRGTVRDAKTSRPVGAELVYQRVSGATATPPDNARADTRTGQYRAAVKPATVYAVTVLAKGYFSKTDTVATGRADLVRDLTLTRIETGAKLTLNDIEFDLGKYDLRPPSYPELNRLATLLRDNPTLKIRLEGHTDVIGDFDANLTLSRNRVGAVKAYLVGRGIGADRIDTLGYGASRPITSKNSEKNRRVELIITES